MPRDKNVIALDGKCLLCNGFARFLAKNDRKDIFVFTHLQSQIFKSIKSDETFDATSVVLITPNGTTYYQSDAVIITMGLLGGAWSLFKIFRVIPKPIRDFIYKFIAKRRYFFAKPSDSCLIPDKKISHKFILD